LADHFFLQRSGELVTKVGFNAENEIIHTLAFLAAAMIWSQTQYAQKLWAATSISVNGAEEIYECFIVLKNDVIAEQVKVLKRFMTLHLTMIVEQEESTKECHIKATSEQAQLVTLAYASDT